MWVYPSAATIRSTKHLEYIKSISILNVIRHKIWPVYCQMHQIAYSVFKMFPGMTPLDPRFMLYPREGSAKKNSCSQMPQTSVTRDSSKIWQTGMPYRRIIKRSALKSRNIVERWHLANVEKTYTEYRPHLAHGGGDCTTIWIVIMYCCHLAKGRENLHWIHLCIDAI